MENYVPHEKKMEWNFSFQSWSVAIAAHWKWTERAHLLLRDITCSTHIHQLKLNLWRRKSSFVVCRRSCPCRKVYVDAEIDKSENLVFAAAFVCASRFFHLNYLFVRAVWIIQGKTAADCSSIIRRNRKKSIANTHTHRDRVILA